MTEIGFGGEPGVKGWWFLGDTERRGGVGILARNQNAGVININNEKVLCCCC